MENQTNKRNFTLFVYCKHQKVNRKTDTVLFNLWIFLIKDFYNKGFLAKHKIFKYKYIKIV